MYTSCLSFSLMSLYFLQISVSVGFNCCGKFVFKISTTFDCLFSILFNPCVITLQSELFFLGFSFFNTEKRRLGVTLYLATRIILLLSDQILTVHQDKQALMRILLATVTGHYLKNGLIFGSSPPAQRDWRKYCHHNQTFQQWLQQLQNLSLLPRSSEAPLGSMGCVLWLG